MTFSPLKNSNLIISITSKDSDDIESLSYIGGSISRKDNFGIINVSRKDSYAYKGKVLAHEILHSLGAVHEEEANSLMHENLRGNYAHRRIKIGHKTIESIEKFMERHKNKFRAV